MQPQMNVVLYHQTKWRTENITIVTINRYYILVEA